MQRPPTEDNNRLYLSLLQDKYTPEYKLDRLTKTQAEQILQDFAHVGEQDSSEVSSPLLTTHSFNFFNLNFETGQADAATDLHATIKAVVFIASRCPDQQQHTRPGLKTLQLLQGRPRVSLEAFHQRLQQMLLTAKVDFAVKQQCSNGLNRLTIQMQFYDKFYKLWSNFGVRDRGLQVAAAQRIKDFAWLLFIVAKSKLFHQRKCREDITETAFLLHACLMKTLTNLPLNDVECDSQEPAQLLRTKMNMPQNSEECKVIT